MWQWMDLEIETFSGRSHFMISDDIVRASSSRAPEAGPAASALALLAHKPGLSIRMLAIGVGLHMLELFAWWIDW